MQTIGQVSKAHRVTARMLRYYEQVGLIQSGRGEGNGHRVYDEHALQRIQRIVLLRKLQIPVKRIGAILENADAVAALEIFRENIARLDREVSALSLIRSILARFVEEIERIRDLDVRIDPFQDDALLRLTASLSLEQRNVKERFDMGDLDRAADIVNRLRDVRVVYLPPMAVAAVVCRGEGQREAARSAIQDLVRRVDLPARKPDFRVLRFEHANATGQDYGGTEMWASIPEDLRVPAPFVKKRFLGGQYAAHAMGESGFETWLGLQDWVNESERYRYDASLDRSDPPIPEIDGFGGMQFNIEELLNYANDPDPVDGGQIDCLLPIRDYAASSEPAADPVDVPGSLERCGYAARICRRDKLRILGFTRIMTAASGDPAAFEAELERDGRMDALRRCRKEGAPILGYGSLDLDSQIRGGWRWTCCLFETDVVDGEALRALEPYRETIDASRWLIFEYGKGEAFDDHATCGKLGYTWNGVISGSIVATPPGSDAPGDPVYCWYPVK